MDMIDCITFPAKAAGKTKASAGCVISVLARVTITGVVFSAAVDGGKLMGYFNLAWFAWGSPETNLGDTIEYNTLVRVTSPYDRLATAVIKLFVHYNVRSSFSAVNCAE